MTDATALPEPIRDAYTETTAALKNAKRHKARIANRRKACETKIENIKDETHPATGDVAALKEHADELWQKESESDTLIQNLEQARESILNAHEYAEDISNALELPEPIEVNIEIDDLTPEN